MIPAWIQAIVLGAVQGLTEFLPISSSAHLVLVPYLLGWPVHALAFDVALHIGTLAAVLLAFRRELAAMIRGLLGRDRSPQAVVYRRVALLLVPASVPVAAVGYLLEDAVEDAFASPFRTSLHLLLTAALLVALEVVRGRRARAARGRAVADGALGASAGADPAPVEGDVDAADAPHADTDARRARPPIVVAAGRAWTGDWRGGASAPPPTRADAGAHDPLPLGSDPEDPAARDLSRIALPHAMAAGVLQAAALLPGVSRSGSTIAGGVFAGLTREAATRFSFLLSIPALVGAIAVSVPDLASTEDVHLVELLLGILTAFVTGMWAIRFLVRLVARQRLVGFAVYCLGAAAVGLIGSAVLGPPSAA